MAFIFGFIIASSHSLADTSRVKIRWYFKVGVTFRHTYLIRGGGEDHMKEYILFVVNHVSLKVILFIHFECYVSNYIRAIYFSNVEILRTWCYKKILITKYGILHVHSNLKIYKIPCISEKQTRSWNRDEVDSPPSPPLKSPSRYCVIYRFPFSKLKSSILPCGRGWGCLSNFVTG